MKTKSPTPTAAKNSLAPIGGEGRGEGVRPLARFYVRRRGRRRGPDWEVVDRHGGQVLSVYRWSEEALAERERLTDQAMAELRPPRPD